MKKVFFSLSAVGALFLTAVPVEAGYYINDDYSTFLDGDLVGQGGWVQQGASATAPVQILGGELILPPGGGTGAPDDQDVLKSFSFTASPGATLYYGLRFQSLSAGGNSAGFDSAYIGGLWDGSFVNARLAELNIDNDFYQMSARVNGQGSNPFGQTPDFLQFGADYLTVVVAFTYADGVNPDRLQMWVNPTSSSDLPGLSLDNLGTPVTNNYQGFVFSQFRFSHEVHVSNLVVADTFDETLAAIPEPGTYALLAIAAGLIGWTVLRRSRRETV